MDDADSPLGLAKQVESLLKLPQSHCRQRGICCSVATFKGSLHYEDIRKLAQVAGPEGEMARDFIALFLPYPDQSAVTAIAPIFVDRVRAKAEEKGQNPDQVSFFHCKFLLNDGRCGVHEDRPVGCRTYPFPHEQTIYHPGCGFEKPGRVNWAQIKSILNTLGLGADGSPIESSPQDPKDVN